MKKTYKNTEGIDFELELTKTEKEYAELHRDFMVVTGWNTEIAQRYNYLADLLPSIEEVDLLLRHHLTRHHGMMMMSHDCDTHTALMTDIDLTRQAIIRLYKLKVAVAKLQDNPVATAKQFVKAQYAYDEPKTTEEAPWSWKNILCSRKKNKQ